MTTYKIRDLANLIDHTELKPNATKEDMTTLCNEAVEYNFKMVAINSVQSKHCAGVLEGTNVEIGAAIGFPLGQTTIESKVFETENAIKNGATEIDYMINLTEVKAGNFEYVKDEMNRIVDVCRNNSVTSKVIFENFFLNEEEIIKISEIAKEVKPDFIKTSTGFADGGAKLEDVKLMKKVVGDAVKVKAAGGIRDADTFIEMINAGAERIGASSGIKIINELTERSEDGETISF